MIKNLYRMGKALQMSGKYDDFFTPWQDPFPKADPEKAIVLYIEINNGIIESAVKQEPYKPKLKQNYLYRKVSPNGASLVPTYFFYPIAKEEDHKESVRKLMSKVERSFNENTVLYFGDKENQKQGLKEIEELLIAFKGSGDYRYLLTFKVNGKWLGEYEDNIKLFDADAYSKYFEKSRAKDKLCAVTYQLSPEVWGRVDTLGFTVNDITFSRGGFSPEESYKMFSASPDAVKILEGARNFALAKLTRSFYSLQYFIVPHFIEGTDKMVLKAVERLAAQEVNENLDDLSRSIFNNERIIAHLAEESEFSTQGIFYDIFFFQINQAQFAIKLHLTDILPSRFSQIFQSKAKIEKRYKRLNQIKTKEKIIEFYVTFRQIQRYFSTIVKKEVVFHPFFYNVLEAVFYGLKLNQETVVSAFVAEIQRAFKQRQEYASQYILRTKEAFALWHFFLDLQLFDNFNTIEMNNQSAPRTLDEFVEAHPEFFREPYKKAAFFLGCLTEILLQAQRRKIGNEPFLEKLNGLSFDDQDLRTLFPRLLEKTNQYGDIIYKYLSTKKYVERLRAEIIPLLIDPSDISRAEISFAFSAGLVMQKEFTQHEIALRINQKEEGQAIETEEFELED